jgi:Fur family ferric uptake transcriptional regulator
MKNVLKARKIKSTKYRIAVLELLEKERDRFLTIDEIHERISEMYKTFDFSTAYRTLELFESEDMIYKTKIDDKIVYSYLCPSGEKHHHLICKRCGKKVVLTFCPFDSLEQKYNDLGFESFEHTKDFYGICKECKSIESCVEI